MTPEPPHTENPPQDDLRAALEAAFNSKETLYDRLNALRDWVNRHFPAFELYLEDVWNERAEGETHFEYILRSRRTLEETAPIGADIYRNHQDAKGVWHLDDYERSVLYLEDFAHLAAFIRQYGDPA